MKTIRKRQACLVAALIFAVSVAAQAQNAAEKVLVGTTKVTVVAEYRDHEKLPTPTEILVHHFDVPGEVITIDHSPAAHILSHDPIAHIKGDTGKEEDPANVANHVRASFSKTLVSSLTKTGVPTREVSLDANEPPSIGSLIIRGNFTTIKQGNKAARMMIGLGRGASDVQADVIVSLITPNGPVLLAEFEVDSVSGKKPGAVETMGIGSAATSVAASGGTDGKATVQGDSSRLAAAAAREVESRMIAQGWISAAPGAAKDAQ
ncbi:DUF4410 domain-containing protein [Terriglobus albidus]|uniref:DUF4410 domain-containing protein n=1 Tax=Terriglobus albidus TaxID=1592106 RepID=UPI0021E0B359|nr:DUF4410 domain-containing protein [Terriglobus albidus]